MEERYQCCSEIQRDAAYLIGTLTSEQLSRLYAEKDVDDWPVIARSVRDNTCCPHLQERFTYGTGAKERIALRLRHEAMTHSD